MVNSICSLVSVLPYVGGNGPNRAEWQSSVKEWLPRRLRGLLGNGGEFSFF
jgi:hypothetical protein